MAEEKLLQQLQTTLGDGYQVERELGRGGMSRVFVASEIRLHRRVVVKVLRPEFAAVTSTERFEREIALCARCQHPHIVPLLSAGHVGQLPFFTMPFVEGESLRDRLIREGPLPVAEVIRLLIEISDALGYAHRLGVIHRDIKPENILMQDGHAVIADFGVAKALDTATGSDASVLATSAGIVLGTPAYMAPEQATGDPGVDHRVDLYALGVLAYELLTGRPPFGDLVPPALVSAQLTRTPPIVTKQRKDCPPALAALVTRLLHKDASGRPASAEAVRLELLAIEAHPSGASRSRRLLAGVGLLTIIAVGIFLVTRSRPTVPPASTSGIKSLAVLPFQNIGGDSTTDYFGQGIAEELITALGRLGAFRVASSTSSFAARAASSDLSAIGRRLGVGAVLEGSVQQVGSRIRVSARLVDVGRETQLWSGDYRTETQDVFEVQDSIARAIARALQVTLAGEAAGRAGALVARGTQDQEAHDRYLRGRYFLAQRTLTGNRKAIEAFRSALARDSSYALAWSGLADAYRLLIPFGDMVPTEAAAYSRPAAARAFALDSTLAEVQITLGFGAMWLNWDMPEAERRLDRALQINPNEVSAHLFRAWLLAMTDRNEQAVGEIEKARMLDPLSLIVNARVGTILHLSGRNQEAVDAYRKALELDSTFAMARAGLAYSLAILGRCNEAVAIPVSVEALLGGLEGAEPGVVLARCGRADAARHLLGDLQVQRRDRYISADLLAAIHAALGENEDAFRELDRAFRERAFTMPLARVHPLLRSLHADPRWATLMIRSGMRP